MFEQRNAQFARLGLFILCLIVCGSVASAQETGGDLVGGAGIFRPKNPDAKRSSGPRRPPRPTMTPAEISAFFARRQEAWDTLDAAVLASDYTSDCRLESPTAGIVRGRLGVEQVFRAWFDAFLDLKTTGTLLVVDGAHVAQLIEHF